MKRLTALLLVFALLFTGCAPAATAPSSSPSTEPMSPVSAEPAPTLEVQPAETPEPAPSQPSADELSFFGPNDPALLQYINDSVYAGLIQELDSEEYLISEVNSIYLSREYLEELAYNSQANIYFGYTLAEVEEQLEGTKYVFTLGEDGETIVTAFEEYDDTYARALKNLAVGMGVILISATVSLVAWPTAPAISLIFGVAAKGGAASALMAGGVSTVTSLIISGIQGQDFDEALRSAALTGSEAFEWAAIAGTLTSGVSTTISLHRATWGGLTMDQAALIQRQTKLPLDIISRFHSMEEFQVYQNAHLVPMRVNNQWAYVQDIDWDYVGSDGLTNAQRVLGGNAPLDPTGKPYELHHIGQASDSPLAILTNAQHHSSSNYSTLHFNTGGSQSAIDRNAWNRQRQAFWKDLLAMSGHT